MWKDRVKTAIMRLDCTNPFKWLHFDIVYVQEKQYQNIYKIKTDQELGTRQYSSSNQRRPKYGIIIILAWFNKLCKSLMLQM